MIQFQNRSNLLKKVASWVGIAGLILIGFPVGAQQQGETRNPKPSIFNEPPYTRPSSTEQPPEGEKPGSDSTTSPSTPSTPSPGEPPIEVERENVVALAAANSSFKTLTKALKAAGLTETLSGQGPFTVFAPTDQAFAKLPPEALQDLLKPENKEVLIKILNYHVVSGKVQSSEIKSGEVTTVEGAAINVKVDADKGVMVNEAKVIQPDIQASNGVLHAIDQVILPPDL